MSVMRFTGANSREAMGKVRARLGDDALILANRRTEEGVEILAMADQAVSAMADVTQAAPEGTVRESHTPASGTSRVAPEAAKPEEGPAAWQAMSTELLREMQSMRSLLVAEKLQRTTAGDCRARLEELLDVAGFSRIISGEVLAGLPQELQEANQDDERPMAWLERQLGARLGASDALPDPLESSGILALVGPTGVGKTTTTAKLATRYVMRYGAERVVLITTDGFRIGAHEQLSIYAKLLGIPMHALDAEQPLDTLLAGLGDNCFVIIDTVGMSQRDQRIIEQVARLRGGDRPVGLMLLLNGASQPETLEEVITNFRQAARAAGTEIGDCLVTKLDEAGRLGPLLDAVIRHGLCLRFVAHGQRVPEDLSSPDPLALARQALEGGRRFARDLRSVEVPASIDWSRGLLGQGRRLAAILTGLRQHIDGFSAQESVWNLASLPSVLQGQHLQALLERENRQSTAEGILWSARQRLRGCDWSMPDLVMGARGGWQALPRLQHRQPPGQAARLAEASSSSGARMHLLPSLPDVEGQAWLEANGMVWLARSRPSQRVLHEEESLPLSRLASLARRVDEVGCRWQGQPVRVALSCLDVRRSLPSRSGSVHGSSGIGLRFWFGEIREVDTGRSLGQRYWLSPARLSDDVVALLTRQLEGDVLPRLTRRACQRLRETYPETTPEVHLLMAGGLAAVAARLDQAETEWAMDLRAELLGLLGGRRRCSDNALLEALLHLYVARDAVRHLGAANLEGRH